jgi:hypothetical protein
VGGWNFGRVEWSRRIPARSAAAGSVVARGKKRKSSGGMGFGSGFIGEHDLVEKREREGAVTGLGSGRRAALACPSGAWQPLGIGGPTWLSGGQPAEAFLNLHKSYLKIALHLHPMCSFTYIYDLNTSF